ncbi:IclR family transcriptional regulator C-terminal domain-containing protein [Rhodoblastus sp.]|uniref:IclR family transcriptional regulator domain-containing protein n=1 Tax=Rhodoblastus sp. TaxID=1962975 RepID=UPI0026081348|nr:IclR family transcriptional regulator C-terminal domain-containing protein [Rhodoblastus sp.]
MARQAIARKTTAAKSRSGGEKGGSDQVQSLARALSLLNRIAESPDDGATLTDLAQQVGLPPSTAHRLLLTLEQERYVRFSHDRRIWTVGVQAFVSGCAFIKTRNLAALARPHMRRLMEESGETVNLAIEDQDEAVYLAQVECRQMMRVFARPGTRVLLHCSAVGKAIFSQASDKAVAKALHRHGMPRLTPKTITTPAALRAELQKIRIQGYALDDEEHAVGLRCIAAPIRDETGDIIASVSISGPMARIEEDRIPILGRMVMDAARAISSEMGASAPKIDKLT